MELPEEAPVGASFGDWLGLDDMVIDLDLTPNRGDCFSARGIARDLAAMLATPFVDRPGPAAKVASEARISVKIAAAEDCPIYLGRVVENMRPDACAPLWLRERLRRCGVRSIDAVVDIGNFVMLELGQPLHMFDLDKLKGGIEVRRGRDGDRLTLLDGTRLEPNADDLVIADADAPVALAGIMGGADSGVGVDTRNVFIESAHFTPAALAGRARHHRLDSEAARRFERGVDPALPRRAIERATELLLECAGGVAGSVGGVEPKRIAPRAAIKLERDYLAEILGCELKDAQVAAMLERLGMKTRALKSGWRVQPPSHRPDIERREDLAEEVARLHGYRDIPERAAKAGCVFSPPPADAARMILRRQLATLGYSEIVSYSLIGVPDNLTFHGVDAELELRNPLSEDMGVLRAGLLAGLARALERHGRNNQSEDARLFEIGRCFRAAVGRPEEREWLAGIACGRRGGWGEGDRIDFYDLKGDLLALLEAAGGDWSLDPLEAETSADAKGACQRLSFAAEVRRDGAETPCGLIGMLDSRLVAELGFDASLPIGYWEVAVDALKPTPVEVVTAPLRQPALSRDLAVVVDAGIPADRISAAIEAVYVAEIEALGGMPENLLLFDVYAGKGVEEGMRSLAFHLRFRHPERSFKDAEAQAALDRILDHLKSQFGAKLRG